MRTSFWLASFLVIGLTATAGNMTLHVSGVGKTPVAVLNAGGPDDLELKPSSSSGNAIVAVFPVPSVRTKYAIAFKASASGRVLLSMFAPRPVYGGASVAVSGIAVNGKAVGNADYSRRNAAGLPVGFTWLRAQKSFPEFIPASGRKPASARVSFSRQLKLPVDAVAGETYRVTMELCDMAPYPEDEKTFAQSRKSVKTGKASTARKKYPIFENSRLPKPGDIREVTAADFKIDPARVARLKGRSNCYADGDALWRYANYLMENPKSWASAVSDAMRSVNKWDLSRKGFAGQRYIYATSKLGGLAQVYAFTGQPELGRLIKFHMLRIADMPIEFWIHAELRGYNQEKPCGALETSSLTQSLTRAMSVLGDELFTPGEREKINRVIRENGHRTLRNWLETNPKQTSNFTAVIASGLYVASRYFNDADGAAYAASRLKEYLNGSIEDDGSYGEGPGYFGYPIGAMKNAAILMSPAERNELFAGSPFQHSARWVTSQYFLQTFSEHPGRLAASRAAFGDNGYWALPSHWMLAVLTRIYHDPLAAWLWQAFQLPSYRVTDPLADFALTGTTPKPKSPEKMDLPLAAFFESGETFLRTSWRPDSVVIAMKASRYCRTRYTHARPESNNIVLAGKGEYFIVAPNSASYRSPLHKTWDRSTRSANTVLVDRRDQKMATAVFEGVADTSEYLAAAQDSAICHVVDMVRARRTAVLFKASGIVVLVDDYAAKDGEHQFDALLHFFNRDSAAKLTENGEGVFRLTRPRADLAVAVIGDAQLKFKTAPGFMHATGRDYSPGGENEGKPGSSIELAGTTVNPARSAVFFTVLQVLDKGTAPKPVARIENGVEVDGHRVVLSSGKVSVDGKALRLVKKQK